MRSPSTESRPLLDSEPASRQRPTFAARAHHERELGRAQATADVAAIRKRAAAELHSLRQRLALELAAAQAEAERKSGWPLWAVTGALVVSLVGGAAWAWSSAETLHEATAWAEIAPQHDVRLALAYSNAIAERERARVHDRPAHRPRRRLDAHRPCNEDPFDPMNDCL